MGLRGSQNDVAWELTYFDQEVSDAIIYSYNPALFAGGYIQALAPANSAVWKRPLHGQLVKV